MHFVFGYAGIPSEAYDYIYRMRNTLTNGNIEFEGVSGAPYESRHSKKLLHRFKEHTLKNRGSETVGFAVIYVRADDESTARFEESFFPSILVFPVDWHLEGCRPDEVNRSCKKLFDLLLEATIRARIAIEALHKEVVERANRTPLLLPLRNFRSKQLRDWVLGLQGTIVSQQNASDADLTIKVAVKRFEAIHPLKKVEDVRRKQPCYIDDHEVEFHTPGKALHGMPHAIDGHPVSCFLEGYRRLGAPFNPSFHYDCVKGTRGNLKGSFFGCHGTEAEMIEGNPHINIAPNDYCRT